MVASEEEIMELTPSTNWYLLSLIFIAVVITKVLRSWNPLVCEKLVHWLVLEPSGLSCLRSEVSSMKRQLKQINMMDHFAEYAKLQRKLNTKDQELQLVEHAYTSRTKRRIYMLSTVSSIAILIARVGVSVYHRHIPVAVIPVELMYPLSSVLAFPTGVIGAIGCPLWGIACTQFVDTVIFWWSSIRTT